jgi:hypothetical protein
MLCSGTPEKEKEGEEPYRYDYPFYSYASLYPKTYYKNIMMK